ncbi:orotate phosphoribosyltransferase [Acinetobacter nectaris]|uniref:orotate phosphoribosyltransferase n=1 Tax=Acinetobacter nectaris TaxID=1219382 RepID=UPI001F00A884|nr:orotate phosphoribosyltransferase [Acinetobacter nectaris]MCF8998301.1 orotate phosphoribosyltransferase [Acinetobacter nectaris]MCF9027847.1 orotate phosphoribosyltransferase [Acinetobacter nectaris]MCF9033634.1 orotate phosphoribosyltransferase [Acinetobacter nectaris]
MTTPNQFNPEAFIELALSRGVLKFGEFTLKSGRVSPYFFNAGLLNDGEALSLLAQGYAAQLMACNDVEVIFGPAYKGIPFVAATAVALSQQYNQSVPWGFNRKEAKDHGEGGVLVGASVAGKKVWIIDDVITAGTAIREVVEILKKAGASIAGVLVALDRQERGQGKLSAIQEVQKELEIPVHALITMKDLMDYLEQKGDQESLAGMQAYRVKYGI